MSLTCKRKQLYSPVLSCTLHNLVHPNYQTPGTSCPPKASSFRPSVLCSRRHALAQQALLLLAKNSAYMPAICRHALKHLSKQPFFCPVTTSPDRLSFSSLPILTQMKHSGPSPHTSPSRRRTACTLASVNTFHQLAPLPTSTKMDDTIGVCGYKTITICGDGSAPIVIGTASARVLSALEDHRTGTQLDCTSACK